VTDSANDSDWIAQERNPDTAGHRPSVLVVGAGPTGLLLASELQRRRVSCHLIDAPARTAPLGPRDGRASPLARDLRVARNRWTVPRNRR
jgi:NADPH-dependent 2,4-dienoyl-CoA reductase/sulfur reductase-like enzyme